MSKNEVRSLDEGKMWHLCPSAKEQKLKIAAELDEKRAEYAQLQKRLSSATGFNKLILENNSRHLRADITVLYDQVRKFTPD